MALLICVDEIENLKMTILENANKIADLEKQVSRYKSEVLKLAEKNEALISSHAKEIEGLQEKNDENRDEKISATSRDSDDIKSYLERINSVETKVDAFKKSIGEMLVEN